MLFSPKSGSRRCRTLPPIRNPPQCRHDAEVQVDLEVVVDVEVVRLVEHVARRRAHRSPEVTSDAPVARPP